MCCDQRDGDGAALMCLSLAAPAGWLGLPLARARLRAKFSKWSLVSESFPPSRARRLALLAVGNLIRPLTATRALLQRQPPVL